MSLDAAHLFEHPRAPPCSLYDYVLRVYAKQETVFIALSVLRALAGSVLSLAAAVLLPAVAPDPAPDPSGAVRFFRSDPSFLLLKYAYLLLLCAVESIFLGALMRAAADTCAGRSSKICPSLRRAYKTKGKVFCFLFLFLLSVDITGWAGFLLLTATKVLDSYDPGENVRPVAAVLLPYLVLCVVAVTSMVGAVPAMVVERASALGAVKRSWTLFRGSIGFALCVLVSFYVIEISILASLIVFKKYLLVFLFVVMAAAPLSTILVVVLYIVLRIRLEGLTQSSLAQELSSLPDTRNTFEMLPATAAEDRPREGDKQLPDIH
eukprot:CAMPEP_0194294564 /NCGR_PEP_ID=MMETSP0169-20130528/51016_1 /TAXON_ID=218684 /ORGANISM="Corethron pennatum, Strain L29A3" /LENGTH=320 /DNA_ID=CAMNT_0039043463 /DNA_START=23 /DNA_END=982 /DNA_ORIENTATION=-